MRWSARFQVKILIQRNELSTNSYEGLSKMSVGPPLESTASRGKGYNLAVVAILDKPETVQIYAEHPEHLK